MDSSEIENQLGDFAAAFAAIPEVPEPPQTTLDIISERTREKYWNRLLRYFLDPSAPHGFGSDFLREFIELVEDQTEFGGYYDTGLDAVQVESEISSDRGRPDLLLYLDDEWFVCLELKVTASETGQQTKEYATSTQLGDLVVSEYTQESRGYVYLTKQRRAAPAAAEFSRLHWRDVQATIGAFLQQDRGQYPSKSTAQLADFRDTLREETMTDRPFDTQQAEFVELYLTHQDAIDPVHRAFDRMVETQTEEWATQFQEQYLPESWDCSWNCGADKYGKIYKDEWRIDENGKQVKGWSDAAFRLEFRHDIRKESSWKKGEARFRTDIPKNSDEAYRDRCQSVFNSYRDELRATIDSSKIAIKGNKRVLTEATYSFDPTRGPDGYYTALRGAFEEHIILVPQLTEIFEETYMTLLDE